MTKQAMSWCGILIILGRVMDMCANISSSLRKLLGKVFQIMYAFTIPTVIERIMFRRTSSSVRTTPTIIYFISELRRSMLRGIRHVAGVSFVIGGTPSKIWRDKTRVKVETFGIAIVRATRRICNNGLWAST